MKRTVLGWCGVGVLLAAYAWTVETPSGGDFPEGPVRRLFGPFAGLAAEFQWALFQQDVIRGKTAAAIEHAETAIELDPSSPRGYELLASHLAFDLASQRVEPDPARRRAWVEAGIAVAARGEAACSDPGAMAFLQGYILQVRVESDPEIEWPGGVDGLWRDAEAHYARAAGYGVEAAGDAIDYIETRAAD